MSTMGTEVQKVGNTISNAFGNLARFGGDATTSIKRSISEVGTFFKNGATSVVGINTGKIPTMQKAINDYCGEINQALSELKNYDPKVAFKGASIVPALEDYIAAVIEACGKIVSNMQAFNDQLTAIKDAYVNKDQVAASNIKTSADSARNQFQAYGSSGTSAS